MNYTCWRLTLFIWVLFISVRRLRMLHSLYYMLVLSICKSAAALSVAVRSLSCQIIVLTPPTPFFFSLNGWFTELSYKFIFRYTMLFIYCIYINLSSSVICCLFPNGMYLPIKSTATSAVFWIALLEAV